MRHRPRVLYILPAEGFGGAERQGTLHISLLPRFGVDVIPVVGPGRVIVDLLADKGVPSPHHFSSIPREFAQPFAPVPYARYLLETLKSWRRAYASLVELSRREQPDVIFACRTVGWTLSGLLGRSLDVPVIWRAGSRAHGWGRRLALRALSRHLGPAALAANCEAVADSVGDLIGAPIHIVPNGVDSTRFDPRAPTSAPALRANLAGNGPLCGLAVRPSPDKGMDYLADVMRKVTQLDTRVRFVVAGEFGWRARVEQRFRELGLAERITFAGHVQDMPAFYARCDLVLMTSRTRSIEGSPNALLEAMAMEKPVVATAVGGIPELIEHGVNGYLAAADDTTAFSRYVLELLEFRERRESMGRAARRTVIERFSQDVAVQKTAEAIQEVLAATLNRGREGAGPGPEARVPGTAPRPHGALASGLEAKRR